MPFRRPSHLSALVFLMTVCACDPADGGESTEDSKAEANEKPPGKSDGPAKTAEPPAEEPTTANAANEPGDEDGDSSAAVAKGDGEPAPALTKSCEDDSDCAISHSDVRDDGTCCIGCASEPGNVLSVSKLSRWCSAHVRTDCPKKKCVQPPAPKCQEGTCVAG